MCRRFGFYKNIGYKKEHWIHFENGDFFLNKKRSFFFDEEIWAIFHKVLKRAVGVFICQKWQFLAQKKIVIFFHFSFLSNILTKMSILRDVGNFFCILQDLKSGVTHTHKILHIHGFDPPPPKIKMPFYFFLPKKSQTKLAPKDFEISCGPILRHFSNMVKKNSWFFFTFLTYFFCHTFLCVSFLTRLLLDL